MFESEDKLSEEEKFEAELLYEREMSGWYDFDFGSSNTLSSKISRRCNSNLFPFDNTDTTSTMPRLFPTDFALNHPAAAAFNKVLQNTNNTSNLMMNSPSIYAS